jgi:lipopolysaccharide transport system permease protein
MLDIVKDLWQHRDLVISFAVRDIKARYKQTFLGTTWALIQPLSMMLVFTLVFSFFAKVPSDGIPYPIFAYSALIFSTFFANCVSHGTIAMVANATLIRKIWFPRATLLIAILLATGLDLAIASVLFLGMMVYYKVALTLSALWVIPLLLLQVVFTLGVISLTAAAHVNFRDIGHALPLVTQLWMFATPVAYPLSAIPRALRPLYLLNPLAAIIDGYRQVLILGKPPDLAGLALSASVTILLATTALSLFRRAERTFADVI